MIIKNILADRSDGGKEIWFNDSYDDIEGFIKIANFLRRKYNGEVVHEISVSTC